MPLRADQTPTARPRAALQFAAAFGFFVIIFQYLQLTLGYSTLEARAAVVPQGLEIGVAAILADRAARSSDSASPALSAWPSSPPASYCWP